jgi:hypothetical protein
MSPTSPSCAPNQPLQPTEKAAQRPFFGGAGSALAEESLQLRFRLVHFCNVRRRISRRPRLEVIAEVRPRLVVHFLRGRLAAMLGDPHVVVHAHLANVQLRPAFGAFVQTTQRQAQLRKREATLPADQIMFHAVTSDHRRMPAPVRPLLYAASVRAGTRAAPGRCGRWPSCEPRPRARLPRRSARRGRPLRDPCR